ncbi:uncharacterized protein EDB91DRAFT_1065030 [Suillus paluster]|uniref:uncharacterized protein n=1 Tax=Suillus paluster TaxID=48578 RepID=UPI001B862776|nr:uncharacterized protein EDB91DRAFT_1065030 [Suillus paluster]KAG1720069.1 hypothetical protein EDB91DRAFT_1065030 [Suillus paluster]
MVHSRRVLAEGSTSYKCPAPGCIRTFGTTQGLNSHLRNAASCKWHKLGKGRELDRVDEEGMEGLPDGIVDEVEDDLFQLIPLGPDNQEQGEPIAGPSTSRHRTALAEEEDARVTETHPTAGRVIRMEETVHAKWQTQFGSGDGEEAESDCSDEDEDGNLFYPFASRLDWQVGCWAVQEGIGHKAFDRLFAIPGVRERLGLAYYNIRGLHQTIDSIPPRAKWQSTYLAFNDTPDYKHELHYRDPLEAIQTLLGNPAHAQDIVYKPSKIFTDASHSTCIYNEMWTGHWWHAVQVSVSILTTLL